MAGGSGIAADRIARMQPGTCRQQSLVALLAQERRAFAAKMRAARAVLGWSQSALAHQIGMTQRAVHMLEQGDTEPRRATVVVIKNIWLTMGFTFEDLPDGAFRLTVPASALDQASPRRDAGKLKAAAARRGRIGALSRS